MDSNSIKETVMSTARTDSHKPSLLDPAEYNYLGCFYQGGNVDMCREYGLENGACMVAIAKLQPFNGNYAAKSTCDHCGANFDHGVVYLHTPSQEYVTVGHICAANTVGLDDRAAKVRHDAARAVAIANEIANAWAAGMAWRSENAAVVEYLLNLPENSSSFLTSVAGSLRKYGTLYPRQAEAVTKCIAYDASRAARAEQQAARTESAPALAAGRYVITGKIVSTKWQESQFGNTQKMLVELEDGNRVWGSVPSSLADLTLSTTEVNEERTGYNVIEGISLPGTKIQFTATVEISDKDEHFGFFARPAKTVVLEEATA